MTTRVLTHRVEGEGEPLLLLNGGMMTYASWAPVSSRLQERYRLLLCDLRGQLLSPGEVPATLEGNLADLTNLLDHLGIDSAHVLGTSYGGEIGLYMAALAPERVRSVIAVAVSDYATRAMREGAAELRGLVADGREGGDKGRLHDRLVDEVYSRRYVSEHGDELAARREKIASLPDAWFEGVAGIVSAVESLDLRPHVAAITCPTLIVVAADDRAIPPERSRALAVAIGGAEIREHPTSGHALVAEDPEWLTATCLDFLARHSGVGADQPVST